MFKQLSLFSFLFAFIITNAQQNIELRSVLTYNETLNDIWGYADSAGNEFAFVGLSSGISIVNVTNPDSIFEIVTIPGPSSTWRDIKTWNQHAYITNEKEGGLLILDLRNMLQIISGTYWTADSLLSSAHNIYIDENGIAYIFGYNDTARSLPSSERGVLIANLNNNPMIPELEGIYSEQLVHDGFVRGDTMWTAELSKGQFAVVDVTDKSNPQILATAETPNRFTHNCWLSDDGNTLFTTDEKPGAYITSYDVSDLENITELHRWRVMPNNDALPHNTHVFGNYLITSYYRYGVNIIDITNPAHMVEVGFYDTSPFGAAVGFQGNWGAYPFLPSGNLLATDRQTGLFVLTPDYVRACYLEGEVILDSTGQPLSNVSIEIMTTNALTTTNAMGQFKSGYANPGTYDIRLYRDGCLPKIIAGVSLDRGITTTLNVAIQCTTLSTALSTIQPNDMLLNARYPNSGTPYVYYKLNANGNIENTSISVYDMSGSLMSNIIINDREGFLEISQTFAAGIYIVRLSNARTFQTVKLIKN